MKINLNLASFLLVIPFALHAQTTPVTCTAATVSGTHSLTMTGRNVSSTAVFSQVYNSVGTATFDGVGAVTLNLTTNTNQSAGVTQKLSGTYTLPTNCLGTLTITTGGTATFILIPYNSGLDFTITGQDATYSYTGTGTPQPAACVTATLSGAYAFTGNGYSLSSGAITGVNTVSGLLNFDGSGNVTGSWSIATNGSAAPDTITGHYSVAAPGCVASATITDPNNAAYTLTFTMTTAAGADFAVDGTTSTNMFSGNGHSTFTNPGLAVEEAAGSSLGTPPGSLFSVYGFGLSNGTNQTTAAVWPFTLNNAKVMVNGESAPIYYVNNSALGAEGLINAQMPLDIQPGVATVVVTNGTAVSNSVAITVPPAAVPAVFVNGNNHAVAQNFPAYTLNSSTIPAKAGSVVVVYFTGGGAVQGGSSLVTGHGTPASQFPVTANATATVGGVNASLDYVGLTPTLVGVYQAVIVIPNVAAGEHNLVITIGGVASNTTVISTN